MWLKVAEIILTNAEVFAARLEQFKSQEVVLKGTEYI